jgi:ketosteroid isomerase-like protein
MRRVIVIAIFLLCTTFLRAQGTDAKLQYHLETLHAKWMKAFYTGDNATMDELEARNLALVMPIGVIWHKNGPRTDKQASFDPQTQTTLSDVSVQRFGDTAILTGVLTTKSTKENSREVTTVVFVRGSGKWRIASAQWTPITSGQ